MSARSPISRKTRAPLLQRTVLVTCFAVLMACTDVPAEPAYDFEIETERMVVVGKGREFEALCEGTVPWIDGYIDSLAPYYAISDGVIGRYYWYSQEQFDESGLNGVCNGSAACQGFVDGMPAVLAANIPMEHEIAHVLQRHVSPPCISMIEEGLAEFLRGPLDSANPSAMNDLLDATFTGRDLTASDYSRARNFVSFLVHAYELRTVIELCAAVPKGSSRVDFDAASVDLLGKDLTQLLDDYASYPLCNGLQDRGKVFECGRPPVAEVRLGEIVSFSIDASCASAEAVGPSDGRFHVSKQVRLLEEGDYSIDITPAVETNFELRFEHCASCADDPDYKSPGRYVQPFLPGDYTLGLWIPLDYDGQLTIHVRGW